MISLSVIASHGCNPAGLCFRFDAFRGHEKLQVLSESGHSSNDCFVIFVPLNTVNEALIDFDVIDWKLHQVGE